MFSIYNMCSLLITLNTKRKAYSPSQP